MLISNLSIVSDTTLFGDALTRISEILALAKNGDASASKTATRIQQLLSEPSRALDLKLEAIEGHPFRVRVQFSPTPALNSLLSKPRRT